MARRKGPLAEGRNAPPERVLAAMDLLSRMRYSEVRLTLMEQFRITRNPATRAITMARLLMAREEEEVRPQMRAVMLVRLERLLDRAEDEKDFSAAVRAVREISRICGLAAPDRVEHIITPEVREKLAAMTEAELELAAKFDRSEDPEHDGGGLPH